MSTTTFGHHLWLLSYHTIGDFDSIIEIKIEIILNPLLGQIRDFHPLEPCVARRTVTKNAVLLRRFCLAQKIDQGSTIQLLIVLFLSADNRCANSCTAAGKQQGNPQCKVACIAGLRTFIGCSRLGAGRLFLKSCNGILDCLCHFIYFGLLYSLLSVYEVFSLEYIPNLAKLWNESGYNWAIFANRQGPGQAQTLAHCHTNKGSSHKAQPLDFSSFVRITQL